MISVQFYVKKSGEVFWSTGLSLGCLLDSLERDTDLKANDVEVMQIERNEDLIFSYQTKGGI